SSRKINRKEYKKVNAQNTVVNTGTVTVNLLDLDQAPLAQNTVTNVPDGRFMYDTVQFAFNKRFGRGLFLQTSYDYQWRNELKGGGGLGGSVDFTNTLRSPSTSPLDSDPMRIGFFNNANPEVPNRQKTTNWQGRAMARYVFPFDVGAAANVRVQSGFGYARIYSTSLPTAGTVRVFAENLDRNRSETVPILDLRADKAFRLGRYRFTAIADLFNATNSNGVTNFGHLNDTAF